MTNIERYKRSGKGEQISLKHRKALMNDAVTKAVKMRSGTAHRAALDAAAKQWRKPSIMIGDKSFVLKGRTGKVRSGSSVPR